MDGIWLSREIGQREQFGLLASIYQDVNPFPFEATLLPTCVVRAIWIVLSRLE
ncbi:hypothetical protein GCM10027287_29630 [Bordetella muralis]